MKCRGCGFEHGVERCEVAKRRRESAPEVVVNDQKPVVNAEKYVVNTESVVVNRQVEWQQKNRERYNAKMREFMTAYREKKRRAHA